MLSQLPLFPSGFKTFQPIPVPLPRDRRST